MSLVCLILLADPALVAAAEGRGTEGDQLQTGPWWGIGPLAATASPAGLLSSAGRPDPGRDHPGRDGPTRWREVPAWADPGEIHDVAGELATGNGPASAAAFQVLSSPAGGEAWWYVSADDLFEGWVNGERVAWQDRPLDCRPRRRAIRIRLRPGANTVFLALANVDGRFCFASTFEAIPDLPGEVVRLRRTIGRWPRVFDREAALALLGYLRGTPLPESAFPYYDSEFMRSMTEPGEEIGRLQDDLDQPGTGALRPSRLFRLAEVIRDAGLAEEASTWLLHLLAGRFAASLAGVAGGTVPGRDPAGKAVGADGPSAGRETDDSRRHPWGQRGPSDIGPVDPLVGRERGGTPRQPGRGGDPDEMGPDRTAADFGPVVQQTPWLLAGPGADLTRAVAASLLGPDGTVDCRRPLPGLAGQRSDSLPDPRPDRPLRDARSGRFAPPSVATKGPFRHRVGRPLCGARNWRFAPPSVAAKGPFRHRVGRDEGTEPGAGAERARGADSWRLVASWTTETGPHDIADVVAGPTDGQAVLLTRTLFASAEVDAWVFLAADDWLDVWLNGRHLFAPNGRPSAFLPRQQVVKVRLRRGVNPLLLRVENHAGACAFALEVHPLADWPARSARLVRLIRSFPPAFDPDLTAGVLPFLAWPRLPRRLADAYRELTFHPIADPEAEIRFLQQALRTATEPIALDAARFRLAELCGQLGLGGILGRHLRSQRDRAGLDGPRLWRGALAVFHSGRFAEGIGELQRVADLFPELGAARLGLAEVLSWRAWQTLDYRVRDQAWEAWQRVDRADRARPAALAAQAGLWYLFARKDTANRWFEAALRADPRNLSAWLTRWEVRSPFPDQAAEGAYLREFAVWDDRTAREWYREIEP
ncbi:MAG: hypothetical protein GX442_15655 [Candidatus Riflebacteria bacterium]|nr:hypothetical protein [Candidatus Riflebacteria bacterium]